MLTQLATLKSRLKIDDTYLVDDALLESIIKLVSGRFQKECNRVFGRQSGATEEFGADEAEVIVSRYPIELVSAWHLKTNQTEGWVAQSGIDFLIRRDCVISLTAPLGTWRQQARVTYDGGYVLPGAAVGAGQTALPDEVEQACLQQCAHLYQNRNSPGMTSISGGGVSISKTLDLLPEVSAIMKKYERYRN